MVISHVADFWTTVRTRLSTVVLQPEDSCTDIITTTFGATVWRLQQARMGDGSVYELFVLDGWLHGSWATSSIVANDTVLLQQLSSDRCRPICLLRLLSSRLSA